MQRWIVIVLMFLGARCLAAPVWESAETINGLSVYQDHRDSSRFYYEPPPYRVSTKNGAPQVFYRLLRYMGTTETRDSNEFDISGILSLSVEQASIALLFGPALTALKKRYPTASLRMVPVDGFSAELIYVAIDPAGEEQTGAIDALGSGDAGDSHGAERVSVWTKRRFTLGFDPLTAELFWNNFENDRLQLSLSYSILSAGMRFNRERQWERDERRFANSVPVHISMREHADHFSRTETWQLASRRRTDVIVMCYDFFEPGADDLYRVSIDVRFKTLGGQDYVEKVRFEQNAESTEQTVSFRLARSMEEPYLYRVTRIFRSKPVERSDWIEHRGLLLDVTSYSM